MAAPASDRPARLLPAWRAVVAVVAHPDDESFGLGAVISGLTSRGAAVHVLCYTRGEASTLNPAGADLYRVRAEELRLASAELGIASCTLLSYPDSGLADVPRGELAGHLDPVLRRAHPDGLLVFDDTGVTGHPDHQAATAAALTVASAARLPVLAWALPAGTAERLRTETGQHFAGHPPAELAFCVRVDRERQRAAANRHASQISPAAVLWRRLQLQGDCEYLRWLAPPEAQ